MVTFPPAVVAECRKGLEWLTDFGLFVHADVVGVAQQIVSGGEPDRGALLEFHARMVGVEALNPAQSVQFPLMGGAPMRAALGLDVEPVHVHRASFETFTARLARIDDRYRAKVLASAELALNEASRRVASVVVSREIRKASLSDEQRHLAESDKLAFMQGRPVAMRAALTDVETERATEAVEPFVQQVLADLIEASAAIAIAVEAEYDEDVSEEIEAIHEEPRERAVSMFRTALIALVLGRLGRVTDGLPQSVEIPPNLASDVLEVAGGADATEAGGVLREGAYALSGGVRKQGVYLACAQATLDVVNVAVGETLTAAEPTFRHSGKTDARREHQRADGLTRDRAAARDVWPGQFPHCGCDWEPVIERTATA